MKSSKDPRHKRRRQVIKQLFANSYSKQYADETTKKILASQNQINEMVKIAAPAWPLDKINKIDLSIIQLAVYEIQNDEAPPKVVIDEAVELAKEYGGESSPSFVNGVLGNILIQLKREEPQEPNDEKLNTN